MVVESTRIKIRNLRNIILELKVKDLQDGELLTEIDKTRLVCEDMLTIGESLEQTIKSRLYSVTKLEEKN